MAVVVVAIVKIITCILKCMNLTVCKYLNKRQRFFFCFLFFFQKGAQELNSAHQILADEGSQFR